MPHDVFVYDALRTARGKGRGGALHGVKPVTLAAGLLACRRQSPACS
jgi:acetyl-CoA C-acetyltransferase